MSAEMVIRCKDLGKRYKVYPNSRARIAEWVTLGRVKRHKEKWALRDISFEVPKGSALGVVGANGAGKSTLLKVLTGVTPPTNGLFEMKGRIGSLLELGSGFHSEFSGRENIFMNAAIMGISRAEVKERFDELAEFAELGEYLYRPVRTYSSGMTMRLGFSVAMLANPDILVLDEVMAVGDQRFQKKCMNRIREIRQSGTTILFVSHSTYHVRQICDRAIWVHDGRVVSGGDPTEVTDQYVNYQLSRDGGLAAEQTAHGKLSDIPHLGEIKLTAAGKDEAEKVFHSGDQMDIHVEYKNPTGEGRYHIGLAIVRNDDICAFMTRSMEGGVHFEGKEDTLVVRVPLKLVAGEFYISGYLLDDDCELIVDQRLAWTQFRVKHEGPEKGIILVESQWLHPSKAE